MAESVYLKLVGARLRGQMSYRTSFVLQCVAQAVNQLAEEPRHEVVVGPSFDGGYYLLGVRSRWFLQTSSPEQIHPLFRDVSWSTGDVLGQTLSRCRAMSCLCDLIGFWYDVDTIEDLDLLTTHLLDYLRYTGQDVAPRTTANVFARRDRSH